MQFSYPEVLYALFLLIIPFIVHLFQLRKFRKENFTNVKFLKRLTDQTRKSSRLKKWLVLCTRLLLLAAIILAFAQPYFSSNKILTSSERETVIYLDNSYSMQVRGQKGRLLERSVQEIMESLPAESNITLITNSEEYSRITTSDLQQITYSASQQDPSTIILKAGSLLTNDPTTEKNLLIISDFQEDFSEVEVPGDVNVFSLALRPEQIENVKIDTAYLSQNTISSRILNVTISFTGEGEITVPVSLYDGEELLGKSGVQIKGEESTLLEFPLGEEVILDGRISLEDTGLPFDNTLFFSINKPEPITVVSINAAQEDFLKKIYTAPEFNYTSMPLNAIDFNSLSAARVIILNELAEIPPSLLNTLQEKLQNNNVVVVIPSSEEPGNNLQLLIREMGFSGLTGKVEQEKLISGISYAHPFFTEVFEEETQNFEYPQVQISYSSNLSSAPILSYQDQQPFFTETNGNFLFTAPLNKENSNFTNSPLVVPTFYRIGTSALQPPGLYYLLGAINKIEVPVAVQDDNILQIASGEENFIPLQQNSTNKITITLEDLPVIAGNYKILKENQPVLAVSFNVPREESELNYNVPELPGVQTVDNIPTFFNTAGFNKEEGSLWKWFVTFALFLLIIETLLLKYLK